MSAKPELYAVGRIVKAHGIKGDVVVTPMTNSLQRFAKLKRVFIGRASKDVRPVRIESVSVGGRGVRLKFAEIEDRTAAEGLRGEIVFVDKQERVRIPKGTFFIHDVIGLRVVDEEENNVGVVKDVLQLPAHDIYVIDSRGREVMVPAVKEFIKLIDISTGTMKVKLIDGLVD